MTGVTVHVTMPRSLWIGTEFALDDDSEAAQRVGRYIRQECDRAIAKLRDRNVTDPAIDHIEIALVDTARAEVEDDPEAHTP